MKSPLLHLLLISLLQNLVISDEIETTETHALIFTTENFRSLINDMDGSFVMFYAPWCRYCKDFYKTWQDLAQIINIEESKFVIAQVDCTKNAEICHDLDITGYPTLVYYGKGFSQRMAYNGLRDISSLTHFLAQMFTMNDKAAAKKEEVQILNGMAYLNDQNIEKFISSGYHFVMFYMPWCSASQKLAPIWGELGVDFQGRREVQIGKVNCEESPVACQTFSVKQYPYLLWFSDGRAVGVSASHTLDGLAVYADVMLVVDNHQPEKFKKQQKVEPVVRITEDTYDSSLDKNIVYINYFAPWCAHCMQLSPLWTQLGEKYINESRVLIADVDCSRSKPICEMEKIDGLPTLILYRHREKVNVDYGAKPLESLIASVETQLLLPVRSRRGVVQSNLMSEESSPTAKDEL